MFLFVTYTFDSPSGKDQPICFSFLTPAPVAIGLAYTRDVCSEHIDEASGLNSRKPDSSRCSVTDLDYDRGIDCCDALCLSAQECDDCLCSYIGSPAVLDNPLGVGH